MRAFNFSRYALCAVRYAMQYALAKTLVRPCPAKKILIYDREIKLYYT